MNSSNIEDEGTIPFFSVIVPLYNKESHIKRAIESVFAQFRHDWELIVIDDCSIDNGPEITMRLIDGRTNCALIRRDTPGPGGYAARNLGATLSKGPWLAFLDADDEWTSDHLSMFGELINHYPYAKFLCSGVQEILQNGRPWQNGYLNFAGTAEMGLIDLQAYVDLARSGKNPVFTSACAVRKDFFLEAGGFPTGPFKRGGDRETWLRLIAQDQLAWIKKVSAVYHRDAENMVTKNVPFSVELCMDDTARALIIAAKTQNNFRLVRSLKSMLNYERKRPIRRKIETGELGIKDVKLLFWDVDTLYVFIVLLFSFLPSKVMISISRLRRNFRR